MFPLVARRLACVILSLACLASAEALTVVPSALELAGDRSFPQPYPAQYMLTIYQDVAQSDYTSIIFDYDTDTQELIFRGANIDESSDWYFVATGESFSLSGIAVGNYDAFNGYNQAYELPFGEFYLGGATGLGFIAEAQPNRTVLAWAHFSASASGITLLDSAVAYDAGSIVVGTLSATAIPEPAATPSLIGLAALALIAAPRRSRAPRS